MAAGDGLVSMTPSSIAHSGTSASINADGGVDFTAVTSLSLNGVFTSEIDNYLIVCDSDASTDLGLRSRLRVSGSDASGSNYTRQYLYADGTSRVGLRDSTTFGQFSYVSAANWSGFHLHMYGPALAQPTAYRSVTVAGYLGGYIEDSAITHSLSTAYDGITIYTSTGNITGNVHVFGYEE